MADNIKAPAVRIVIGEYEIDTCSMEPLDCLSKEGIAAFAALSGGDHLRHYCEYLKARGYAGDAARKRERRIIRARRDSRRGKDA